MWACRIVGIFLVIVGIGDLFHDRLGSGLVTGMFGMALLVGNQIINHYVWGDSSSVGGSGR